MGGAGYASKVIGIAVRWSNYYFRILAPGRESRLKMKEIVERPGCAELRRR